MVIKTAAALTPARCFLGKMEDVDPSLAIALKQVTKIEDRDDAAVAQNSHT